MAVLDKIRMAAQWPDCLVAMFPDDGGRLYSPLRRPGYPVPGSTATGVRDIDDGLLSLVDCRIGDGCFRPSESGTPVRCAIKSKADLRGTVAHHTLITKMYIGGESFSAEIPRHVIRGIWQGSLAAAKLFGCDAIISGTSSMYQISASISLQNEQEYQSQSSGAARVGTSFNLEPEALRDRWFVMAATIDAETMSLGMFFDGMRKESLDLTTWLAPSGAGRRKFFSHTSDGFSAYVKMGYDESVTASGNCLGVRYAWGLMFDRVLSDSEIEFLSK